jgi:hypothetical protein
MHDAWSATKATPRAALAQRAQYETFMTPFLDHAIP